MESQRSKNGFTRAFGEFPFQGSAIVHAVFERLPCCFVCICVVVSCTNAGDVIDVSFVQCTVQATLIKAIVAAP